MCESNRGCQSNQRGLRRLTVGSVQLLQCLGCQQIGLEIGTAYITLQPAELQRFSAFIDSVIEDGEKVPRPGRKLNLKIDEGMLMLSVNRRELEELRRALSEASRWQRPQILEPTMTPSNFAFVH